jgi:hypothetical protein
MYDGSDPNHTFETDNKNIENLSKSVYFLFKNIEISDINSCDLVDIGPIPKCQRNLPPPLPEKRSHLPEYTASHQRKRQSS